jgi:hypothetical protein
MGALEVDVSAKIVKEIIRNEKEKNYICKEDAS